MAKMTNNLKIRACFMQNFMELHMKKKFDPKAMTLGVWGLKSSLGQFSPKGLIKS